MEQLLGGACGERDDDRGACPFLDELTNLAGPPGRWGLITGECQRVSGTRTFPRGSPLGGVEEGWLPLCRERDRIG